MCAALQVLLNTPYQLWGYDACG
nr:hypothetical protein [Deinococcus pimensis]